MKASERQPEEIKWRKSNIQYPYRGRRVDQVNIFTLD